MMIFLKLFLTFLKIGAFTFGGGYGMISIVKEASVANGWLTEEEFMNLIAVAESTPGPIAINMATFIGSSEGAKYGFFGKLLGAFCSTLGVVLPSLIIILIIAALITNLMKFAGVQAFLKGVRPCVVGLIGATAITLGLSNLCGIASLKSTLVLDLRAIVIFAVIVILATVLKKLKKKPSPFMLILVSAGMGMLMYSF